MTLAMSFNLERELNGSIHVQYVPALPTLYFRATLKDKVGI